MFVQGMRDLQPVDERECRDVLTAVGDIGQLVLKVAAVRFEIVAMPHLDGEKMVVVPLSLLARCVLVEEFFEYVLKVVDRMWRQGVEPI